MQVYAGSILELSLAVVLSILVLSTVIPSTVFSFDYNDIKLHISLRRPEAVGDALSSTGDQSIT